jgi:hypothetical protein
LPSRFPTRLPSRLPLTYLLTCICVHLSSLDFTCRLPSSLRLLRALAQPSLLFHRNDVRLAPSTMADTEATTAAGFKIDLQNCLWGETDDAENGPTTHASTLAIALDNAQPGTSRLTPCTQNRA